MQRSSDTVNLKGFTRIVPASTVRSIGTTSMSLVTMSNRHSPAFPKGWGVYFPTEEQIKDIITEDSAMPLSQSVGTERTIFR